MSRIIHNSLLNGTALAITSVLSLLLVPVLVRTYGLDTYGLIPLLRLLTPLGAIGVLALGLPSLATRAAAAPDNRPEKSGVIQSTLITTAVLLGLILSLGLVIVGWPRLVLLLGIQPSQHVAFATGFYALVVTLPVLLAGSLFTSALTGAGHFRSLRVVEVVTSGLYVLASLVAALSGASIQVILLALLATDLVRAIMLGACAHRIGLLRLSALLRPDWHWLAAHFAELRIFTTASLSGYARKYAPATILALLFGPSAIGLYDAVERIPRAFKTLLGLITTAVLPRALALDAAATHGQLQSLVIRGVRLVLFFMLPAQVCVIFYAEPLLRLWLGADFGTSAHLLVLLMIPYSLETMLSIFSTASLSRLPLMRYQNTVNAIEIGLIVILTLVLASSFGQTSAYWAFAFAALVGYLLRIGSFLASYEIPRAVWNTLVAKALIGAVLGNGGVLLTARFSLSGELPILSTAPLAIIAAVAIIFALWTHAERRDLAIIYASLRKLIAH